MAHSKQETKPCNDCPASAGCMSGDSCDKLLAWEDKPEQEAVNPKEACGAIKPAMANISATVMAEVGVGMHEGARKYGSHNYRVTKVTYSTYHAAMLRHIFAPWEGEDIDPDSGVNHISKLIACACVLRDAQIQGMLVDDRPPKTPAWHKEYVQGLMDGVLKRHPESVDAFTEVGEQEKARYYVIRAATPEGAPGSCPAQNVKSIKQVYGAGQHLHLLKEIGKEIKI